MHQNEVKIYIEAKTKQELVAKMHGNNVKHGKGFVYDMPVKDGKNWVVWFTADLLEYTKKEQGAG